MNTSVIVPFVLLFLTVYTVYKAGKLTLAGSLTGGLIAIFIYVAFSWTGTLLLAAFFVLATIATSWKKVKKEKLGLKEDNDGKRNAYQVWANGGFAAILALLVLCDNEHAYLFEFMLAGAFSAATADTLSSEFGNVYGTRYINILSWKKDQRGLDGVVSAEGTLFGFAGSLIIALLFTFPDFSFQVLFCISAAGLAGNIIDSVLGATLERKGVLGNNAVNFINTATGAVVAGLLYCFFN